MMDSTQEVKQSISEWVSYLQLVGWVVSHSVNEFSQLFGWLVG